MSGENCTCGHQFIDAEDFRDHMPCPGSEVEQLRARVEKAERTIKWFGEWLDGAAGISVVSSRIELSHVIGAWDKAREQ